MRRTIRLLCLDNSFVAPNIYQLSGNKELQGTKIWNDFITRTEADALCEEALFWTEHETATEWGSYRSKGKGPLRYEMTFFGLGRKTNMNIIRPTNGTEQRRVRSLIHAPKCTKMASRIQDLKVTEAGTHINSFRINEYLYPESGSLPHRDHSLEGTLFLILSLHEGVIHFDHPVSESAASILLPARSLLLVTPPASKEWRHCVPAEPTVTHNGRIIKKDYRQSIVFFSLDHEAVEMFDEVTVQK
eukprot:TRINITY_DN754_c1_g2_i1.p1 TRINITY_DN754_c1_g2~~TRINITY_DN754_c1_g2_i1.p1  ORF type:complete len:245 (+),score=33.55 TRINITY_DN754_c1_g2_i1:97-831(+)